jgi:DNA-directed RNA polymerase omega subunit
MPEHAGRGLNLDRALEQFDSKFRFVLLASARAEQLVRGAHAKVDLPAGRKPTRVAMEEIKQGLVEWGYGLPAAGAAGEQGEPVAGAAEEAGEQH